MRALDIAFHRTGAVGVGAVDQRRDLGRLAAPHRSAEIRRDLKRQRKFSAGRAAVEFLGTSNGRAFEEPFGWDCQVDYGFA